MPYVFSLNNWQSILVSSSCSLTLTLNLKAIVTSVIYGIMNRLNCLNRAIFKFSNLIIF